MAHVVANSVLIRLPRPVGCSSQGQAQGLFLCILERRLFDYKSCGAGCVCVCWGAGGGGGGSTCSKTR